MWLIDNSEGEGVGGGCAPSHAACIAETYCLILFLTVRFTLWGMLLCLPLGQLLLKNLLGGGKLFLGRENSRATPPPPPPSVALHVLVVDIRYSTIALIPGIRE